MPSFRLGAALILAASLALGSAIATHAEPDAEAVGTGTLGSCTQAALMTALTNGGTITFNCGGPATILVLAQQTIAEPTTIDGGGVITLTGGLASKLFQSLPGIRFELRNITLDSAFSDDSNGAAIRALGPLVLTNVTVQNSIAGSVSPQAQARYCGGAVFLGADATIRNSTFSRNTALLGGGAICARTSQADRVIVQDSVFTDNLSLYVNGADATGEGLGGAILADGTSKLSVLDSRFTANRGRLGGAVYVAPAAVLEMSAVPTTTLFASKLQFINNDAREKGGALYNAGSLSVSNVLLNQNKVPTQTGATNAGGGIYSEGSLTLSNGLLLRNEAVEGGGVYVGQKGDARAVIEHVTFNRNTSSDMGGGLYVGLPSTTVAISNTAFHRNTARFYGGGVANVEGKLSIVNSSFSSNQASEGGGLYLNNTQPAAPYISVRSSTFGNNVGGGIYNQGARVELYNDTIVGNANGVYSSLNSNTRFRNTVLFNAGALNCVSAGGAPISDDGRNFSTDVSCPLPNSQTGPMLDPLLGSLTMDNESGIIYYLPMAGSPLIDKGSNCPMLDQMGRGRVGECDIGAIEFGGAEPSATSTPTPSPTPSPTVSPTPSATATSVVTPTGTATFKVKLMMPLVTK